MDRILEYNSELFKALSSPLRISIIQILRDGEFGVKELAVAVNFDQSHVSQQLSILRYSGIVKNRKKGNFVYYSLADTSIINILEQATLFSRKRFSDLSLFLGKLSDLEEEEKKRYCV
jgi:DNA-binding transcriptional ArsR family regulator